VFATVPTRRKNSRLVAEALVGNRWLSDVDLELSLEGYTQCIRLWEEIDAVPRNDQDSDKFSWTGSASGKYTSKDTYRLLCQGSIGFNMHEAIWASFPLSNARFLRGSPFGIACGLQIVGFAMGYRIMSTPAYSVFRRMTRSIM
jgi:hypothetical protein